MSVESQRRLLAVALLALVLLAVGLAMARGWRARIARQSTIRAPHVPPADLGEPTATVAGTYVSTTSSGNWLDRVAAHGLGIRAAAVLEVHPTGLVLSRDGADPVWIPAADVAGVGESAGMAGKTPVRAELLVVRWRCGDVELDTGLRPAARADRAGITALAARTAATLGLTAHPDPSPGLTAHPDPSPGLTAHHDREVA